MSYVLDSYTKLYIPFNGTDGDTDDQTATTGQTVSLEGNACLETTPNINLVQHRYCSTGHWRLCNCSRSCRLVFRDRKFHD